MSTFIPGAEPYLLKGGRVGCVLTHGFTATPHVMRWLGEHLHAQGHTVLGVRLAGHATHPLDMVRSRWKDWLVSVEEGYQLLRESCEHIFLIGHSTGGALSFLLASRVPTAGVVGISTLYNLPTDRRLRPLRLLPFALRLKLIQAVSQIRPFAAKGPPNWHDKRAQKAYIAYPDTPLRSVVELRLMLLQMRVSLDQVRAPALLLHSKNDLFISYHDSEAILHSLGSRVKDLKLYENSGHILPMETDREAVYRDISDFIEKML
jgi:carboxylesterase